MAQVPRLSQEVLSFTKEIVIVQGANFWCLSALTSESAYGALRHISAVFCRTPVLDTRFPNTSDVDFLAFADVPDVLPERVWPMGGALPIDIIWLPQKLLNDPDAMASYGVMAHRLVTSTLIYDRDGTAQSAAAAVRAAMTRPPIHAERIQGILTLGAETVREIGATWDFPALCRFWLQIALVSCIVAECDANTAWCPNAYTRPYDALDILKSKTRIPFEDALHALLDLDGVDPFRLAAPLQRIHARVHALPLPAWPPAYRLDTQWEYRYYRSTSEFNWRLAVAKEMAANGASSQAVLSLRFWAYSLARIPMVAQRVADGVEVAFGRPWVGVRADLERHCPEILDDLSEVLGGNDLRRDQIEARIAHLHQLRDSVVHRCQAVGIPLNTQLAWIPKPHRHSSITT
jgi:hypothetical protein